MDFEPSQEALRAVRARRGVNAHPKDVVDQITEAIAADLRAALPIERRRFAKEVLDHSGSNADALLMMVKRALFDEFRNYLIDKGPTVVWQEVKDSGSPIIPSLNSLEAGFLAALVALEDDWLAD